MHTIMEFDFYLGFQWREPPGKLQNFKTDYILIVAAAYIAEILPIRRKTLSNQSIILAVLPQDTDQLVRNRLGLAIIYV